MIPRCSDLNAAVWKLKDLKILADETSIGCRVCQQIELPFIVKRERLGHLAQLAPAENGIQFFIRPDGSVRVVAVARLLRKPLVVLVDESRHKSVGGFDARDAFESELFNEPILQRQMCTFHTTLGDLPAPR